MLFFICVILQNLLVLCVHMCTKTSFVPPNNDRIWRDSHKFRRDNTKVHSIFYKHKWYNCLLYQPISTCKYILGLLSIPHWKRGANSWLVSSSYSYYFTIHNSQWHIERINFHSNQWYWWLPYLAHFNQGEMNKA